VTVAANRDALSVSSPSAVRTADRGMLTFLQGGNTACRTPSEAQSGRRSQRHPHYDMLTRGFLHIYIIVKRCVSALVTIMLAPEVVVTTLSLPVGANKNTS
jgi:hypothetical protein